MSPDSGFDILMTYCRDFSAHHFDERSGSSFSSVYNIFTEAHML